MEEKENDSSEIPNGFGSCLQAIWQQAESHTGRCNGALADRHRTGKLETRNANIGYYESKKSLTSMADFNKSPYDVDASKVTFQEVF